MQLDQINRTWYSDAKAAAASGADSVLETPLVVVDAADVLCSQSTFQRANDNGYRIAQFIHAEVIGVEVEGIDVVVVVVEKVKSFRAKFELEALCEREGFANGQIQVPRSRSSERIPAGHVSGKWSEVGNAQSRIKWSEGATRQSQNREVIRPRPARHWCSRVKTRNSGGWDVPGNSVAGPSV